MMVINARGAMSAEGPANPPTGRGRDVERQANRVHHFALDLRGQ